MNFIYVCTYTKGVCHIMLVHSYWKYNIVCMLTLEAVEGIIAIVGVQ